jgi:hypothetical protein
MYARLVNELPEGNEWLYEVKVDGYRCLAKRDATDLCRRFDARFRAGSMIYRSTLAPFAKCAGAEADAVGFDQGRNEKLRVAQTGRLVAQNQVHRMDARWSPETFEVCRVEGR